MRLFADLLARMPSLEPAWPSVAALDDDHGLAIALAAVEAVFDDLDRNVPVSQLVDGIDAAWLDGAQPTELDGAVPGDVGARWRTGTVTTLNDVLSMPTFGRRRVIRLLAEAVVEAAEDDLRARVERAVHVIGARVALESPDASVLAALEALDADDPVIENARRCLADAPAAAFLTDELRPLVDPVVAAARFLASLGNRQRLVLEQRLIKPSSAPTLQVLADQLNVTRERVRQIQQSALEQVHKWERTEASGTVRTAAAQIREQVGIISPLDGLPRRLEHLATSEPSPELALLLHLGGPYRLEGDWLVRVDFADWRSRVRDAVERVLEPDRTAPIERCVAAVERLGVRADVAEGVILECGAFRRFGEVIAGWRGNLANRAEVVLVAEQCPLAVEDILHRIGEDVQIRSVKVALTRDDRFKRSGSAGWVLRRWPSQEYPGAFRAVLAALDARPGVELELRPLVEHLASRYGLDAAALEATAVSSPLLIVDNGTVRRRPPTEPYRAKRFVKDTPGVFRVDGSWSYRVVVDEGLLRGEALVIPDSFATFLGVQPGTTGKLAGPVRAVPLAWTLHEPCIRSIHREAAKLGAVAGDLLFARRPTLTDLEFRIIRRRDLDAADAAKRVALLVGSDPDGRADPLVTVGSALGLGAAVEYSATDLIHRLDERGDTDILEALLEVTHGVV